ncbi:thiosulfate oxidation carrier complex protein SoxZ [Varunaivibrio sulfuroxidans]|uniref:Sulfur compound chelating protein SoxZ n=1 Tax=Varunaivibrio sulfuroxidans TaxID=1773489 RepID=A0A4R3JER2_9PROT|nr:thiosulfate oxidation carrier complex protein SoxZ [Varunaivibrio sulfuroxidans]TCS64304.1 sulfur compound chelating protein SoxZ [Varunaivibrio sulfuroxidans]WES31260.1 thiosulfate oxidation carrier complex protein SoxZ [Varunaivibrio sulfuroxidans]
MATKPPRVKVPKTAKKGEVFEIKTLITHPMETGNRKGKDGKKIPRMIINKFTCTYNGNEILRADMNTSISANPYFAFYARATDSGTFEFAWTDDNGKTVKTSKNIAVS